MEPVAGTKDRGPMKYWAFLSYSHADQAAAAKLHRALEHYTLPAAVRRAHGLPRRLIPVFRDVEELEAAAGLSRRLEAALDDSRWLIVLCSKASAGSKYVNTEIEYFLRKHGAARLLCVLLDGDPASSFPPAIRALDDEPLAADLRSGTGFELSVLRLIAAMATVGFTELRDREAQRKKRHRMLAAAAVTGIAIGGLAYWDLFHRPHVDHYADYVRRHGIWEGIDRLTTEAVARRQTSYRFTRHGRLNPPERVDYHKGCGDFGKLGMVGILGEVNAEDDTLSEAFCAARFAYRSDGSITEEVLVNKMGLPRQTLSYTTPELAQFTDQGFAAAESRSGIYYVQFTRTPEGLDQSVRFMHSKGVPRANNRRQAGFAFQYDEAGRVLRRAVLDDEGAETDDVTRQLRDARGEIVEEQSVDRSGAPRLHEKGWATRRISRDRWGNRTGERYFGLDGGPVLDADGLGGRAWVFDRAGNPVEVRFLGLDGAATRNVSGIAGVRQEFDARGLRTRYVNFGPDGGIVEDADGIASATFTYDAHGNNLENRMFDAAGQPTAWDNGVSMVRKTFDARGLKLTEAFFDAAARPVLSNWGAVLKTDFDDRGRMVRLLFLDTEGKPYVRPDLRAAGFTRKLDKHGNTLEYMYLGADLGPKVSNRGWAYSERLHDEAGDVVEIRNYDAQRRLTNDVRGFAITRIRRDARGNAIESTYFGADGKPKADRLGAYGWSADYDSQRRWTRFTYLGADGRPGHARGGFATRLFRYNAFGNAIEERLLDAAGRPVAGPRPALRLTEYDQHQRTIAIRYVDALGRPAAGQEGYASFITERDRYGRVVSEAARDERGRAVDLIDEGWATHRVSYSGGRKTEQWFDSAGRPVQPKW